MLEVSALTFDYADKPLLNNLNLIVKPHEFCHIQGKNGVGKTTFLKLLAGILAPLTGNIIYKGHSIETDRLNYQNNLCYVGIKPGISMNLTVQENCFFDLHWDPSFTHQLDSFLIFFGLKGFEKERCAYLSTGQQRRVALLRLAFTKAKLWLLDEPLVGLDEKMINSLMILFKNHLQQGGQIVLTSHQTLPIEGVSKVEYLL